MGSRLVFIIILRLYGDVNGQPRSYDANGYTTATGAQKNNKGQTTIKLNH